MSALKTLAVIDSQIARHPVQPGAELCLVLPVWRLLPQAYEHLLTQVLGIATRQHNAINHIEQRPAVPRQQLLKGGGIALGGFRQ